ncbi:hypothetical protein SCLCIDRAFT_118580 [Scleroderma citrinum Foug A]|uniref:HAT C-terminal dimerisation domain-containing protein n=1 Tax=Scleroderma citrinum Foug A TaxID=1036808 RepID=A0A0C3ACZ8_9AGAM|nr:hypothetical protein SCLCIDRAFT_118580 [Scleroderma citrinum Foug A]
MAWGGAEEQKREQEAGNALAKNWCDEALKVIEKTLEEYWNSSSINTSAGATTNTVVSSMLEPDDNSTLESEFDRHHRQLLVQSAGSRAEGWAMELRRYLGDLPADVNKETNIVDWWAKHTDIYPTLARIAKDICAIPTTSVPCERLFSGGGEIATDRQSCLGADKFEYLQVLKHTWRSNINDCAATNSTTVESIVDEVQLEQYRELLIHDSEVDHELNTMEVVTTL